jgi:hypothetical protein
VVELQALELGVVEVLPERPPDARRQGEVGAAAAALAGSPAAPWAAAGAGIGRRCGTVDGMVGNRSVVSGPGTACADVQG